MTQTDIDDNLNHTAEIGVFGGTGVYDSGLLKDAQEITINTPYGKTSDAITIGVFRDRKIAFMPRHGKKHTIPPHMINYRANIWAFQKLGVKRIISISAVGSLKEEVEPGNFVLPNQFLDFTKSRVGSFSEIGRVIHISVADPFCPQLQKCAADVISKQSDIKMHKDCTYVCIEGPRFSTKAESKFYRSTGADIIGMTLVPECQLAREAQICYASISTVTDYDVWAEKPVTAKEVIETLSKNVEKTKNILTMLVDQIPKDKNCSCEQALSEAEF
jgi:5'-methylthioadenosine phosphorylase